MQRIFKKSSTMDNSDKYDNVIRFDWAAKYMLRDKADFEILESLVSTIIGEPVQITQLLESESNRQHKNDKVNRVDIKALNSLGEIILVEIQFAEDLNFLQRIVYSTAKTITEHIKIGQDYQNVKKVFSINILYYNLGYGEDYLYHGQSELLGVHTGDRLLLKNKKTLPGLRHDAMNDIFPEYYVVRASQFDETQEPTNAEEEWMRYLKTGYIDPDTKVPGLQKALERLKITQMTEQEVKEYKDYQFNQRFEENVIEAARYRGEQEGYEKGIEKGRKEEKLEIAQKMRTLGMDPAVIAQLTSIGCEE